VLLTRVIRPTALTVVAHTKQGKVWANVEKQCTTLHAQLDLLSDVTVRKNSAGGQ
jgi:hypothetical protein